MHTPSIEKVSKEGPEHKGERVCLPGLLGYEQCPKRPQTQVPGFICSYCQISFFPLF